MKVPDEPAAKLFDWTRAQLQSWNYEQAQDFLAGLEASAGDDAGRARAVETLSLLMDRRYATGRLRRSSLVSLVDASLARVVDGIRNNPSPAYAYHSYDRSIPDPKSADQILLLDGRGFPPQGDESVGREVQRIVEAGYRRLMLVHLHGQRFIGNGLGPETADVRIDTYGAAGDYLASGLDGAQITVHNNGQDQLAQIMKAGRLVVHGDVGQTFMYGAKGGDAYILGNAAGRPLINAVGKPRVVINGTCLDYLAESFMAGDPLHGGGFVVLNGITFDEEGQIVELESPYPGGNLFSLASGGAIYVRDPRGILDPEQLNGGEFTALATEDWELILPYLQENERLFGVSLDTLLTVDGQRRQPAEVYRKIRPGSVRALQAEEAWVTKAKSPSAAGAH
jgi:glutamate synthase domain-containing protein 3